MYGNRGPRRFDRGSQSGGTAPVNVGDELDVKIEAVGEKGDGIAKKNGFVLFVPNVKEGDEVRIKVTRVLRKVGFADVVSGGARKQQPQSEDKEESHEEDEIPADVLAAKESDDFGDEEGKEEKGMDEEDEELDDEVKKIDEELDEPAEEEPEEEPSDEPVDEEPAEDDEDEKKIKKVLDED